MDGKVTGIPSYTQTPQYAFEFYIVVISLYPLLNSLANGKQIAVNISLPSIDHVFEKRAYSDGFIEYGSSHWMFKNTPTHSH